MARKVLISRLALAMTLSGAMAVTALPLPVMAKDKAPKIEFSPAFSKAAMELDKTIAGASKNPAVTAAADKVKAASEPSAKAAARAELDAALGGARARLDQITAVATTAGDKLKLGEMKRIVGILYDDTAYQHQGLALMIESGGLQPAQLGQVQFLAGVTAYQSADYQGAIRYLRPALDSGYRDSQGLIDRVLADAYKRTNNTAAVAELSTRELAAAKAAGRQPSETAIRGGLQAAYDAKQAPQSLELATDLVKYYPNPASWNTSIMVVRALSQLAAQDNLDLMRLMVRTGAMRERGDYVEYIQNADPRRLPGEALKIVDAGVSSGKLSASDAFVTEARQIANGRLSADRASLAGLERDARAGSATGAVISGAADAFLSYDQPAKAEELYKLALAKPGIDKARVLTRLGIAQADGGKYAEAQQSFAQVTGPRAPIAGLWAAYAAGKAGRAAPAAAQ